MPQSNGRYTVTWSISWLACSYFFLPPYFCSCHSPPGRTSNLCGYVYNSAQILPLLKIVPDSLRWPAPAPRNSDGRCHLHNYLTRGQSRDTTCQYLPLQLCALSYLSHIYLHFLVRTIFLRLGVRSYIPLYSFVSLPPLGSPQFKHIVGAVCWFLVFMIQNVANICLPMVNQGQSHSRDLPPPSATNQMSVLSTWNVRKGFYVGLRPCSSIEVWIHKLAMVLASSPAVPNVVECICTKE